MTPEEIIEIFKPWIYNDVNQAGIQLEVIDAFDLPMIAEAIVKNVHLQKLADQAQELNLGYEDKCKCDYPIVRSNIQGGEYCSECQRDL